VTDEVGESETDEGDCATGSEEGAADTTGGETDDAADTRERAVLETGFGSATELACTGATDEMIADFELATDNEIEVDDDRTLMEEDTADDRGEDADRMLDTDNAFDDADIAAPDAAADDAAHDTIFHVQVSPQILPHDGCDDMVEPLPASHSSPTDLLMMPSPHSTRVQFTVHVGPMPFRVDSSHSSPMFLTPFPHCEDV